MAIRPDYMVGTITLTNGSKNFTTAGASLQSANVTGGDTIMTADGRVLIIDKVTGQNAGTLRNNSPISASNVSLVIRFQPDGSKYQGATRDLLERWGLTGNIDALAGLATAKDMLAYFTGAGTMDRTALTAFARTLLGRSNGGQVYGDLGEIPDGQLPARLREISPYVSDCDTITSNGFFRVTADTLNVPAGGAATVLSIRYSATGGYQKWFSAINMKSYERRQAAGTWSAWVDVDFNASRSSSSGFIAIPTAVGNLILQFGTVSTSVDAGGLGTISLPTTYPTAQITATLTSGNYNAEPGVIAPRTGAIDLKLNSIDFRSTRTSTNVRVNYFSMGY